MASLPDIAAISTMWRSDRDLKTISAMPVESPLALVAAGPGLTDEASGRPASPAVVASTRCEPSLR